MWKMVRCIFSILLMAGVLYFGGMNISAASYYETCVPGESESGYYIVKVSSQDLAGDVYCQKLQDALDEAKTNATETRKYKVVVEPGNYDLSTCLHAYSNTYLYMQGVTFSQKNHDGNMFKVGDTGKNGDTQLGYYYKNITVDGGTWNGNNTINPIFKAAHGKNIIIQNVTMTNAVDCHVLEVAGIDGLTINKCQFTNQLATDDEYLVREAVQIDLLVEEHFTGYAYEKLDTKNVSITNNVFKNVIRGVGSHTAYSRRTTDNVLIENNSFEDVRSSAIGVYNYKNCTIRNNVLKRCGRGILVYSMRENGNGTYYADPTKELGLNAATVITNNTIHTLNTDKYLTVGISVEGMEISNVSTGSGDAIEKGNYFIKGVVVTNNTVNSEGTGIRVNDGRDISVLSNHITCSATSGNYHGIIVGEGSMNVSLKDNTILKPTMNGIIVTTGAAVSSIERNTITSPGNRGIYIVENATASEILNNSIDQAKTQGIAICSLRNNLKIKGNQVKKCKGHGIYLSTPVQYKTEIEDNIVQAAAKMNGIQITAGNIFIENNQLSGGAWAISTMVSVKGTIGTNQYKEKSKEVVCVRGKRANVKIAALKKTAVTLRKKSGKKVSVSWKRNKQATGYEVYRSTSKDGQYQRVGNIDNGQTLSFIDKKAKKGKTYYYKVRPYIMDKSVSVKIYGDYSKVKSIKK